MHQFQTAAACGGKIKRQPGTAIAPVGQFGEGRGFEAAPVGDVELQRIAGVQHQPGHRRGRRIVCLSGIIRIGGGDVAVLRAERQLAVARAGQQRPVVHQLPIQLQILVGTVGAVALVAAQPALQAGNTVHMVLMATAALVLVFGAEARHQCQCATGQQTVVLPAQIAAVVVRIQIHDPARMQRTVLRRGRDRQELQHLARAAVAGQVQAVAFADVLPQDQPALLLPNRFAGVEGDGVGHGLTRVFDDLVPPKAERIEGARHVDRIGDQRELTAAAEVPVQSQVAAVTPSPAVVPVAIGGKARQRQVVAHRARLSQPQHAGAPEAFTAAAPGGAPACRAFALPAVKCDHAAGGVAVQRRERAAQHLDAFGCVQIEMRHLAGTIRHRGRDAIGIKPQPANAEAGARAETPDRNLFVLRVVLAVAHVDPGNAAQHIGQRGHRSRSAQRIDRHRIDRSGQLHRIAWCAGRADDDVRQARGFVVHCFVFRRGCGRRAGRHATQRPEAERRHRAEAGGYQRNTGFMRAHHLPMLAPSASEAAGLCACGAADNLILAWCECDKTAFQ